MSMDGSSYFSRLLHLWSFEGNLWNNSGDFVCNHINPQLGLTFLAYGFSYGLGSQTVKKSCYIIYESIGQGMLASSFVMGSME
jgi:hypothetical protein